MSEIIDFEDNTISLSKPYIVTRSKLGATTKILEDKFICSPKELDLLYDSLGEKLKSFQPSKAGFQYLTSFTDNTHYENCDLSSLKDVLSSSSKSTEKLILNWTIGHEYDGIENEMSITVRISNPVNGFAILQAALSKDHSEADTLEFESGSVSVSINGATQTTAEEIFSIVSRWVKSCPQPQCITGLNNTIFKHRHKISFLNYWVFPVLYTACAFLFLSSLPIETVQAYGLVGFAGFMLIRSAATHFNEKIHIWASSSRKFSMFMLTGGDNNQQTIIAAKSKNSSIKLFSSVTLSFIVNIAAAIVVAYFSS